MEKGNDNGTATGDSNRNHYDRYAVLARYAARLTFRSVNKDISDTNASCALICFDLRRILETEKTFTESSLIKAFMVSLIKKKMLGVIIIT